MLAQSVESHGDVEEEEAWLTFCASVVFKSKAVPKLHFSLQPESVVFTAFDWQESRIRWSKCLRVDVCERERVCEEQSVVTSPWGSFILPPCLQLWWKNPSQPEIIPLLIQTYKRSSFCVWSWRAVTNRLQTRRGQRSCVIHLWYGSKKPVITDAFE